MKAKGAVWLCAPSEFCAKEELKGVTTPAAPLCPPPKVKVIAGSPVPVATGAPMPKVLPVVDVWLEALKVNGDVVEPPVMLFVVWVLAPMPDAVVVAAVPKEKTDVVAPKVGWVVLWGPKEARGPVPPKGACVVLPNAGWVTELVKLNGVPKLTGLAIGLGARCWSSGPLVSKVSWLASPTYGGGGGLEEAPKASLKAGVQDTNGSDGCVVVAGAALGA